jgi:hypothetical protein
MIPQKDGDGSHRKQSHGSSSCIHFFAPSAASKSMQSWQYTLKFDKSNVVNEI